MITLSVIQSLSTILLLCPNVVPNPHVWKSWSRLCQKQGSNPSTGQVLQLGPLRWISKQSSSPVATPVPFAPTEGTPIKEMSNLGNVPIADISSAGPSDSVTNIGNSPAAVLSHPIGAGCRLKADLGLYRIKSQCSVHIKER